MNKKNALISIIILTALGSVICFYGTNLILSDVSNMFYMTVTKDVISSLPIFMVALDFVLMSIAVIRLFRYPQYKKRETILYGILFLIFSVLGALFTVITAVLIYGSFTAPYPFPGASILCLIWHVLSTVAAAVMLGKCKKWENDTVRRRMSLRHIVYTVFLCILVFYTFNRFGAVLLMPLYAQWRTLYMTVWFYLSLLLPMANLVHTFLHVFDIDKEHPRLSLHYAVIQIVACLVLAVIVFSLGMRNTQFISAVSPAVAIERLLTKPVDTIFHFILVLLLDLYSLYIVLRHKKERG